MFARSIVLGAWLSLAAADSSTLDSPAYSYAVPDPLPSITPDGVINLFLEDFVEYAGELQASVIASDSSATTYWVDCAPAFATINCPFATTAPYNGITVTQGNQEMIVTHSQQYWSIAETCTFLATTASQANCTNYYSIETASNMYGIASGTPETNLFTRSYDVNLPESAWNLTAYGRPAFIPVSITAGNKAAASNTGSSTPASTVSDSSNPTTSKTATITTGPSVTGGTASQTGSATSSVVKSDGVKLQIFRGWVPTSWLVTASLAILAV